MDERLASVEPSEPTAVAARRRDERPGGTRVVVVENYNERLPGDSDFCLLYFHYIVSTTMANFNDYCSL